MTTKTRDQIRADYRRTEVVAIARVARKRANGISKRSVTFHKGTPDDGDAYSIKDATDLGLDTSVMHPTAEQLGVINSYTRSPKTADELVVFNTLSCNTMPDRDDDYFDADTVDGFAALPAPYGPNGKSYMVGHDYTKLPTGRIFATGTADELSTHFLTNSVYVPNTDQYKSFIEDIDFGINWAVSVGVMLDEQLCSICGDNQYSFFGMGFCESGHWKGDYYDPAETATDDWGDIVTVDPKDPKAVKCLGNMHGARDFYELSQVFLGAQFNAQLDSPTGDKAAALSATKRAVNKGVLLSRSLPILGLRQTEADGLPLQHVGPRVVEALEKFAVTREGDGTMKWTDHDGLVWRAAPGEQMVCLGKEATTTEGEDDDATSTEEQQVAADPGAAPGAGEGSAGGQEPGLDDDGGRPDEDRGADDSGGDDLDPGQDRPVGDLADASSDPSGEKGSTVSKAKILAALTRLQAPQTLLDAVNGSEDTAALEAVLLTAVSSIGDLSHRVQELTPRAALGEKFISSKRADAIHAFVKSHAGSDTGVDTDRFERMLNAFGDDVDQIEFVTEQYAAQARGKLPASVRRSTEPIDPNAPVEPHHGGPGVHEVSAKGDRMVNRIHG